MTALHLGGKKKERDREGEGEREDKREFDVDVLRIWFENEKPPDDVSDGDDARWLRYRFALHFYRVSSVAIMLMK